MKTIIFFLEKRYCDIIKIQNFPMCYFVFNSKTVNSGVYTPNDPETCRKDTVGLIEFLKIRTKL